MFAQFSRERCHAAASFIETLLAVVVTEHDDDERTERYGNIITQEAAPSGGGEQWVPSDPWSLAFRLLLGPIDEPGRPAQGVTCLAGGNDHHAVVCSILEVKEP